MKLIPFVDRHCCTETMKTNINVICFIIMFCTFDKSANAQSAEVPAVHSSGDANADIDVLLRVDDFGTGEIEMFRNLTIQSIPILTNRLTAANNLTEGRLMLLLTSKIKQYGSAVPASIMQPAVDALVAKCKLSTGVELRSRLAVLKNIDDPKLDRMVDELAASQDASKRQAAVTYKQEKRLAGGQ